MSQRDVLAAYLHPGTVAQSFMESLTRVLLRDLPGAKRVQAALAERCGAGALVACRNDVMGQFLKSDARWLWMIDSDMGFREDCLDRLLASADEGARPVIGALCYGMRERGESEYGGPAETEVFPTTFRWTAAGLAESFPVPAGTIVRVDATGAACLLVHRAAAETVGADWFTPLSIGGPVLSEDLSFCARLGTAGIPVHVDTAVRTTHYKPVWLGG